MENNDSQVMIRNGQFIGLFLISMRRLVVVVYSKTRSRRTIGAIKDQPYSAVQTQLEMILIHIDAGFGFNVVSWEFGLGEIEKEKKRKLIDLFENV